MMNYKTIEEINFSSQRIENKEGLSLFVPIDFSASSYASLEYAMRLAQLHNGRIILFHSIDIAGLSNSESSLNVKHELQAIKMKAQNKLNSLLEIVSENGVEVTSSFEIGHLESNIQTQMKKISTDLVVVGRDTAEEKCLRSIHAKRKPTLVVPPTIKSALPSKILLIRDNKPVKESSLKHLSTLCNGTNQLTVLDVKSNLLRSQVFKYQVPVSGVGIEIRRKFCPANLASEDLEASIMSFNPDMVCVIERPTSLWKKILQFINNSNTRKHYDVPTLIIPA